MFIVILFASPAVCFAYGEPRGPATLYVSPHGGTLGECTKEHPCRDTAQAFQFAIPGDTILIQEGDYEGFLIENIRATQEKPLVIRGIGKARIFPNKDLSDQRDNIQISNCDWVMIDNVQSFDANRAGIRIDQSHHVSIRNSVFGNNETWGIFANHSNDLVLENNETFGSRKEHGIYVGNSGDGLIIRGNRSHGNAACGIHVNADLHSGGGRDVVGDGVISGAIIENNVIWDNGKLGGAAINGDGIQDAIIRNNLLYNNHAIGIALFRENGAFGSGNVKVYHNTIDMPQGSRWPVLVKKAIGPVVIMNNVIVNRDAGRASPSARVKASLSGWAGQEGFAGSLRDLKYVKSSHNVFAGNLNVGTISDGITWLSLKIWHKKEDRNSAWAKEDNLFVDPANGNYHLKSGAVAVDRGLTLPEVPFDIEGKKRPQGKSSDAGAYEGY